MCRYTRVAEKAHTPIAPIKLMPRQCSYIRDIPSQKFHSHKMMLSTHVSTFGFDMFDMSKPLQVLGDRLNEEEVGVREWLLAGLSSRFANLENCHKIERGICHSSEY